MSEPAGPPPGNGRRRRVLALAAVALSIAGAAALVAAGRADPHSRLGRAVQSGRWRSQLLVAKATGRVSQLSWSELWRMTSVKGGFGLEFFAVGNTSLEGAVYNAFSSEEDHAIGEKIFRERCALCHGGNGAGWHAPPLNRPLRSGDSDFSIYRTIRDGIPNTAMVPPQLTIEERWRVVGYVRTLQRANSLQLGGTASSHALNVSVPADRLRTAGTNPDEWLTYSYGIDGHRHVGLTQLNRRNVGKLRTRWVRQIADIEPLIEATPLVVDGVIFTTEPPSSAVAIDARTGDVLWRYKRDVPDVPICCMRVNRGLAILDGTLFLGTLDGYLVALDANTGKVRWQTQVGNGNDGYTLTGAPLIVKNSVVIGIAGGEFGIRGYLTAYDPATGAQQWRFYTIPAPGEPGSETWTGDAWKSGGGPTWNTGVYDPELDLLYWGVGNPGPDFNSDVRPGDNLYTDSVIALNASTGKLVWHFQFTPHDDHDWDSTQVPILVNVPYEGRLLKGLCFANRNGFFYLLDRVTGRFLLGKPFVELNWATGLDENGRPIPAAVTATASGKLVKPGNNGGTNWQNAAFDPTQNLVFVHATEGSAIFTKSPEPRRGERGTYLGSGGTGTDPRYPYVRAISANTGAQFWEYQSPLQLPSEQNATVTYSGLLSTAGGLVFGASGGFAFALDSSTGAELWKVNLGGNTMAPPITFRLDGEQVVLVAAGRSLFLFAE